MGIFFIFESREQFGNLWDVYENGYWVVITTNGTVKKNGLAVMGRGVALAAAQRFPDLPWMLGKALLKGGNRVRSFGALRIISFPVKHEWHERADPQLIVQSARQLALGAERYVKFFSENIYLVRPGCGNGGLIWGEIKPLILPILDDRFIVLEKHG